MQPKKIRNIIFNVFKYTITMPLIWIVIIPVAITNLFLEIYHRICFPILGIHVVKRSQYIRIIDRAKLPYLSLFEKLGCAYCGYINGWLHYASVIAGRTESYFCAITHIESRGYIPTEFEKSFVKYGDDRALRKRYAEYELKYGYDSENTKN